MAIGDKPSEPPPPERVWAFPSPEEFSPRSATVRVQFGAETRHGRSRTVNADHYLIIRLGRTQETVRSSLGDSIVTKHFEEHGYGMVVADGMGPGGSGEIASRIAVETLVHLVRVFGKWNLRINDAIAQDIMQRAERFYRQVDVAVAEESYRTSTPGLQTTLTAVFGAGRDLFFAHVGHSRAYLFRGGRLLRLTRDHTIGRGGARRVPSAPLIDLSRAARDLKHILTDTIGMAGAVGPTIDLERFQLDDGDRVLVCTNGLTDGVEEDSITELLRSIASPDDVCRALVDRAVASNVDDDVTAVVADYRFHE